MPRRRRATRTLDKISSAVPAAARGRFEGCAQSGEFLAAQIPFTFGLGIFFDVAAGIGAVGSKPPHFGQIEHLGDHAQRAIGLIGNVGIGVVQLGDVGACDVRDLSPPQLTVNEKREGAPVFRLRGGLAADERVLAHEPRPKAQPVAAAAESFRSLHPAMLSARRSRFERQRPGLFDR